MAHQTITFETVRKIGLEMPGVEEGTMYGSPALKYRGQMLACIPIHKSAESNSLGICVSFEAREDLLREAPDIYYERPLRSLPFRPRSFVSHQRGRSARLAWHVPAIRQRQSSPKENIEAITGPPDS